MPYRPTLIVGVGGTGMKIVNRLRSKMLSYDEENVDTLFQFLVFDTMSQPDPGLPASCYTSLANLGGRTVVSSLSKSSGGPSFREWWYKNYAPPFIRDGAGMIRINGRLCLRHTTANNPSNVTNRISNRLTQSLNIFNQRAGVAGGVVNATIIGSLAGGTGSGFFIDVAYLIHDILTQQGITPSITGVFLCADIFNNVAPSAQHPILMGNTYAALKELDYWQNTSLRQNRQQQGNELASYSFNLGSRTVEKGPEVPPFEAVYIIESKNKDLCTLREYDEYFSLIADVLYVDMYSAMEQEIAGLMRNPITLVTGLVEGKPKRYGSFGVSVLKYPVERILNYCGSKYAAELIEDGLLAGGLSSGEVQEIDNRVTNFVANHLSADKIREALSRTHSDLHITTISVDVDQIDSTNVRSYLGDKSNSYSQMMDTLRTQIQRNRESITSESIRELQQEFQQILTGGTTNSFQKACRFIDLLSRRVKAIQREVDDDKDKKSKNVAELKEADEKRIKQIEQGYSSRWFSGKKVQEAKNTFSSFWSGKGTVERKLRHLEGASTFYQNFLDELSLHTKAIGVLREDILRQLSERFTTSTATALKAYTEEGTKKEGAEEKFVLEVPIFTDEQLVNKEFYNVEDLPPAGQTVGLVGDSVNQILNQIIDSFRTVEGGASLSRTVLNSYRNQLYERILEVSTDIFDERVRGMDVANALEREAELNGAEDEQEIQAHISEKLSTTFNFCKPFWAPRFDGSIDGLGAQVQSIIAVGYHPSLNNNANWQDAWGGIERNFQISTTIEITDPHEVITIFGELGLPLFTIPMIHSYKRSYEEEEKPTQPLHIDARYRDLLPDVIPSSEEVHIYFLLAEHWGYIKRGRGGHYRYDLPKQTGSFARGRTDAVEKFEMEYQRNSPVFKEIENRLDEKKVDLSRNEQIEAFREIYEKLGQELKKTKDSIYQQQMESLEEYCRREYGVNL
ncbi:MAG: hypothetical protein H8D67_18785 [Deltaproteobacteria bacterium]|nr:hypothetical protein [Deltaproteobacteria bacterium]